jgi:long-chain acyl-CoA synthetase
MPEARKKPWQERYDMNTVRQVLEHATKCYASSTALVEGDRRVTYRELGDNVARLMTVLRELGVTHGSRVAAMAQNSVQFTELWLAVPMLGGIFAPLNTRLTSHELRPILDEFDPMLVVVDGDVGQAEDLVGAGVVVLSMGDSLAARISAAQPSDPSPDVSEGDVMSVVYTGGTTGRSKGVMLTHRNRLADAQSMIIAARLTAEDTWLNCSPVFHTSGTFCLLPTFWVGGALVLENKFDALTYADRIQAESITVGFMVPKMIQDVLETLEPNDARLSSLRFVGHGGAPITESLLQDAVAGLPGVELAALYGASELSPMATLFQHQERYFGGGRFASCGQPMIGVEVRVIDDSGAEVATRDVGEVVVRGPNLMKGYWQRPEATADAIVDGYYRTGDLGYVDEEGYLYIADRKKDMIISGGENIYSLEVETVIAEFPGVVEVAVFGRPDEVWGEAVCATIVAEGDLDLDALRTRCRQRLAGYKQPRDIEVTRTPLPRTPAGKVAKRELRAAVVPKS